LSLAPNALRLIRSQAATAAFGKGDRSGKTVDVGQFRGRLVMVYFWVTW
jgi:hypothetical protein